MKGRAAALTPMLASAASTAELRALERAPAGWAFEMKWDGFRTIAVVGGVGDSGLRLYSRSGQDFTARYPELDPLKGLVGNDLPVVLDGEIIAVDHLGRPDFGALQHHGKHPARVELRVFDLLHLGSKSLVGEAYETRRDLLAEILCERPPIGLSLAFEGDLTAALALSRRFDLEGVMAKRMDSPYLSGARTRSWLKIKHLRTQDVIVVGWRPRLAGEPGEDPRFAGALLLAVPTSSGALRSVGRVGTGFSDAERADIATRLAALETPTVPFGLTAATKAEARHTRWIQPILVAEVAIAGWTGDPLLNDTAKLRHPRWRGWRADISPADVKISAMPTRGTSY